MRQLKGKVKETRKEKRERKKENAENKRMFFTVALPILVILCALIAFFVYSNARPKEIS